MQSRDFNTKGFNNNITVMVLRMVLSMEETTCVHKTFEVNNIVFCVTWIV